MFSLFSRYVLGQVLPHSLVGKIGLLCDEADKEGQRLLEVICKTYEPTTTQKKMKKFTGKFSFWQKNVRMRNYFLTTFGARDWMVRKAIKYDFRSLSDA